MVFTESAIEDSDLEMMKATPSLLSDTEDEDDKSYSESSNNEYFANPSSEPPSDNEDIYITSQKQYYPFMKNNRNTKTNSSSKLCIFIYKISKFIINFIIFICI